MSLASKIRTPASELCAEAFPCPPSTRRFLEGGPSVCPLLLTISLEAAGLDSIKVPISSKRPLCFGSCSGVNQHRTQSQLLTTQEIFLPSKEYMRFRSAGTVANASSTDKIEDAMFVDTTINDVSPRERWRMLYAYSQLRL